MPIFLTISQSSHHHLWNLSPLKGFIRNCQTISARPHDLTVLAWIFQIRAVKYFANRKIWQSGLINFASSATTFLYFAFYSSVIWTISYRLLPLDFTSCISLHMWTNQTQPRWQIKFIEEEVIAAPKNFIWTWLSNLKSCRDFLFLAQISFYLFEAWFDTCPINLLMMDSLPFQAPPQTPHTPNPAPHSTQPPLLART